MGSISSKGSKHKQKILDIGYLMLNFGKWTNSLHLLGEGLGKGASNAKQTENIKIETKF
jgi:hypothetical protein